MKVCSVVGIRKSGKTTVVTELIKELKKRGYRVGTVKTVFCPDFTLDQEGSNTDRHKKAGADIIGIKGKHEMNLIYPYGMDDNTFFPLFDVDILLAEGDYEAGVPRIVCAHHREDAEPRINAYTFAISGRIGESKETFGDLPVRNIRSDPAAVADLLESLPDTQFPIPVLKTPGEVSAFCQCGCHKAEKKCQMKKNAPRHIFLTGEKQVGKSTILNRVISELELKPTGYQTLPLLIHGQRKGFYLHGLCELPTYENDNPICIRMEEKKSLPLTETFETLGVRILTESLKTDDWMLMDEIGKFEQEAAGFQRMIFRCLDKKPAVLGVLQKVESPVIEEVKARGDVMVFEVTKENREEIYQKVLEVCKEKLHGLS
ncbi:molybdopterin-guanine dinucleotide biosynthesis protein MobB [Novisyntrophococcus fermenticellae]|uniref:molybdopterin-guanine dinucleotide biosynthesis protein MobB n=1 Tax=Novisyntrophococcus fermenticellae TaxID=2068655 RepID=UPI001E446B1A|nr:molybdopterin-guanine dinucleotide biosynthesis protein MobB [Novisyntrophococcus fermenticellae]